MEPENLPQTEAEKRERLFEQQKRLLDTFLAHGALSPADYEKSLNGLKEKLKGN